MQQCGKMALLDRLLKALRKGGSKVLIFSQVLPAPGEAHSQELRGRSALVDRLHEALPGAPPNAHLLPSAAFPVRKGLARHTLSLLQATLPSSVSFGAGTSEPPRCWVHCFACITPMHSA